MSTPTTQSEHSQRESLTEERAWTAHRSGIPAAYIDAIPNEATDYATWYNRDTENSVTIYSASDGYYVSVTHNDSHYVIGPRYREEALAIADVFMGNLEVTIDIAVNTTIAPIEQ